MTRIQIAETRDMQALRPGGAGVVPTPLMDTDKVRVLLLNLAAGQSVAPCQMSADVLYYVIVGSGHLRVEGEQAELQTGSLVLVPAGSLRDIAAAEPMRVLPIQVLGASMR